MSFSTEKENPASRRFMLVRITPARFIGDDLESLGSGLYSVSWPFDNVAKLERNGSSLTSDSATPTIDDHYYFDADSKIITVKLASAPGLSNVLIAFWSLYYTGDKARVIGSDPEIPDSDLVTWEPRIVKYPKIKQSISNLLAGVLSIENTSLELLNVDHSFEDYLTDNDSFYQKDVRVWMCIDSTINIQKVFIGKVSGISLRGGSVSIDVFDTLARLNQTALMGDLESDVYPADTNGSQRNKPIPYIIGLYTYGREVQTDLVNGIETSATIFEPYSLPRGICVDYSSNNTTTDNRSWKLARIHSDGIDAILNGESVIIDKINGDTFSSSSAQVMELYFSDQIIFDGDHQGHRNYYPNISIGQTIKVTHSGSEQYGVIIGKGYDGTDQDTILKVLFQSYGMTVSTGDDIYFFHSIAVMVNGAGSPLLLRENLDYTLSETALADSGHKVVEITFEDDFESDYDSLEVLTPDTCEVGYWFKTNQDTVYNHSDIVKDICISAGLTVETNSFDNAKTNLASQLHFSIPYFDEDNIGTYRNYAQDIMKSVLGYLTINNDFSVEYHLLEAPSATASIDRKQILSNSLDVDIIYEDIATTVRVENPHLGGGVGYTERTSKKTKYLHGFDRTIVYRTVLQSFLISRISSFLNTHRVIYTWETATANLDTEIGNDVTLSSPKVLGGSGTQDVKIITLDKGTDKTTVQATDLAGIS